MKQDDNPNDEGKVKIKYTTPEDRPRLDDLVGVAKEFTLEFKKGLEFEQMYHLFGITPAKSYLLYGLPGTGKTMAIQALNNSLNHIAYKILQEQMRLAQQGKEYTLREQAIINKQFEDGFKLLLFEYDTGKYGTAYINRGARIIQTFFDAAIWASYKKPVLISIDECLVGDTQILMNDGKLKKIKDVKNGDEVFLGGKVSNKFHKEVGAMRRVFTSFSNIECTLTHPHIILENKKLIKKQTKDLMVGDKILAPVKVPHKKIFNWTPEQLHFVAMIMADGHIPKIGNMIRISVSKDKKWYKKMFIRGAKAFGLNEKDIFISNNSRNDLNLWIHDETIKKIMTKIFGIPEGKKSSTLTINEQIIHSSKKAIKGFLDGYICTDGTITREVSISSNSLNIINSISHILKFWKINSRLYEYSRKNKKHNITYHITFKYPFELSLERKEKQRIKQQKHWRKEKTIKINGKEYFIGTIKKIERLTKFNHSVYDFTTETGIFVANNIITHNCDAILFSRKNGRQGHTEDIKNLETLMKNLQRVHDLPNIYVVMMSNYRDAIDDAVLRAGRVDEKIYFALPNESERRKAFKEFVKKANQKAKYRVIRNVDYDKLAKLSQGYNYADIKNVIDKTIRRKVNSLIDEKVIRDKIIRIKYINGQQIVKSVIEYNDKFKEQNQKRIGFI